MNEEVSKNLNEEVQKANEEVQLTEDEVRLATGEPEGRLNKTVTVNLTTSSWSFVVNDNNLFNANVYVQNINSTNMTGKSWIMIRILDQNGAPICTPPNGIPFGATGGPYRVSYNSGRYTIQAKAGANGSYMIKVRD